MNNCIITYIFGKNKEKLHEPLVIDPDTEYLCITDQKDLTSKHWKIIFDTMPDLALRDKMANVKYNPFKYTNADYIMTIDGTSQIKTSILPLIEEFKNYDIGLKPHPVRNNLKDELPCWCRRGLKNEIIERFYIMAKIDGLNLKDVFLYETNCIIYKNNDFCKNVCQENLTYMKLLGDGKNMIITNQCPLSYIMTRNYKKNNIYLIQETKWFNKFHHNTNNKR